jgi:small subunit ribosomal protein S17
VNAEKPKRGTPKVRVGKVVSAKMTGTVVVRVDRLFPHPLYKKFIRRKKNYYVDDPKKRCKEGDTVRIVETRPLSKLKRWRVGAILERAK